MNNQLSKKLGKNFPEANNSKGFFKSVKNLDFERTGSLDPLMSLAARSSYMRFSKDNQAEDMDKFKDELIKLKEEVNKKRHEMTMMKIEYAKLEEDNNKNVKIIENFLTEAGKNVGEFLLGKTQTFPNGAQTMVNNGSASEEQLKKTQNENDLMQNDIVNQAATMNVSTNTFIRLREVYVINNLKKQISQLKKVMQSKDEEIENYKNNIRCAKYSKLEYNYSNNLNQLIQLKKENENLRHNYEEVSSKFSEQAEEYQKLFNSLNKYRSQYDEIKIKNKILEDNNNELASKNKYLEEKVALLNKSLIHQPVQLTRVSVRELNNTISRLKDEINELREKNKSDRQRLERRIYYMSEDFRKVKDALDDKMFKKCETDQLYVEMKEESRKLINRLQYNLMKENEVFENERRQLYEFIEKITLDLQDIAEKNKLKIEIPKFQLIPLPIEKPAKSEEKSIQEFEKRFEETERNLVDALTDNQERIKYLSQINIEKHLKDSPNKKADFFLTNNDKFGSQIDLENNAVNNSRMNITHPSKHRLMNMNTEKSQKVEENENNELEENEMENIDDKDNISKYSKKSMRDNIEENNKEIIENDENERLNGSILNPEHELDQRNNNEEGENQNNDNEIEGKEISRDYNKNENDLNNENEENNQSKSKEHGEMEKDLKENDKIDENNLENNEANQIREDQIKDENNNSKIGKEENSSKLENNEENLEIEAGNIEENNVDKEKDNSENDQNKAFDNVKENENRENNDEFKANEINENDEIHKEENDDKENIEMNHIENIDAQNDQQNNLENNNKNEIMQNDKNEEEM